jgi:TusA-related sulfurtransferase
VEALPRGAAVRLWSTDTAAVRAIHEFLAFQRHDHHAGAGHGA